MIVTSVMKELKQIMYLMLHATFEFHFYVSNATFFHENKINNNSSKTV